MRILSIFEVSAPKTLYTFKRVRKEKNRYGVNFPEKFIGIHIGKNSWYFDAKRLHRIFGAGSFSRLNFSK